MSLEPYAIVRPRQEASPAATDEFVKLISDPFSGSLQQNAVLTSLGVSFGFTLLIALIFCLVRPYNTTVYAPRLRHADQKHAPPPLGKGIFAWVKPVMRTKENELVDKIGLDAVIFLRFTRMCRNIFAIIAVLGCLILIPVNVVGGAAISSQETSAFAKMSPQFLFGTSFWARVLCAYVFNIIVCVFLWINYRAVTRLRRAYFDTPEYQKSLHARTLMITDIPANRRTDEGAFKLVDGIHQTPSIPRTAIARNVRDLPKLIKEHEEAVRELESVLAKYLKNPDNLPARRPTCRPSKKDEAYTGKEKVDAIDYLTHRIKRLEVSIKQIRESVDQRNAMPYGFASYETIEDAHSVAYRAKNKHPEGTTIRLAPKPNDIIWSNLHLLPRNRFWRRFANNMWVVLLTIIWIVPNALIAVFLSNFANLAKVWPAFRDELAKSPTTWAAVQGILAPAITSLFYFYLPVIFRRLSIRAGDTSKTSRERHVVHKLYAFFIFNNLIVFSIFGAIWSFSAAVVKLQQEQHTDAWTAVRQAGLLNTITQALCTVSPFWITWLLQRNLGAAIDLVQIVNLAWGSFARKVMHPTPRQLIEWSAPPPFDFASYYNYFLFYATIALCFGTLQPLVLPVTAVYFALDTALKKYLLMYVFITKNESGGQFWRILFNRFIFALILSDFIIGLMVAARGGGLETGQGNAVMMIGALVPLLFLLGGFKWYCMKVFDNSIHYYSIGNSKDMEATAVPDRQSRRKDRIATRYGNPALYKRLMTPMVHEKAKHLLAEVYRGRSSLDETAPGGGYSDTFSMHEMSNKQPGKPSDAMTPFEFVSEGDMDFQNYKNRSDFRDEFGGGSMYGYSSDTSRPGTPTTIMSHDRGRSSSRDSSLTRGPDPDTGTSYPMGYHQAPGVRNYSPDSRYSRSSLNLGGVVTPYSDAYESNLLGSAAPMAAGTPRSPMGRVYSPTGHTPPHNRTPGSEDELSYDYFRRGPMR